MPTVAEFSELPWQASQLRGVGQQAILAAWAVKTALLLARVSSVAPGTAGSRGLNTTDVPASVQAATLNDAA